LIFKKEQFSFYNKLKVTTQKFKHRLTKQS